MEKTDWRIQAAVDCENYLEGHVISYQDRQQAAPYLFSLHENELKKEARKGLQDWLGQGQEVEKEMRKLVREFLERWTPAKWKQEVIVD